MSTNARTGPRIVCGVDGSDASKDALRWAFKQAELTGATLVAVSVWSPILPAYPSMTGYVSVQDIEQVKKETADALDELVIEVLGSTAKVKRRIVEGHPAQALLHAAEHADLIVVGSRGHGGFVGSMLGSVSHYLSAHAHCPVVIVRHPKDDD